MKLLFKINKTPDFIFDCLTDMQKFTAVHPVITKMVHIQNGCYKVFETFIIAGVSWSFTYAVTLQVYPDDKTVIFDATVFKWTKIKMTFTLKPEEYQTAIEETILFRSPLPVQFILKRIFKRQHEKLFRNIGNFQV